MTPIIIVFDVKVKKISTDSTFNLCNFICICFICLCGGRGRDVVNNDIIGIAYKLKNKMLTMFGRQNAEISTVDTCFQTHMHTPRSACALLNIYYWFLISSNDCNTNSINMFLCSGVCFFCLSHVLSIA